MSDAMYAAASLYNDPRYFSNSEIRIRNNRIRRQRIYRTQMTILVGAITLVLVIAMFMMSTLKSGAKDNTYQPEFKYYTSITVHSGDTIWSIASENYSDTHYDNINSYISEICKLNHMSNESVLKAGESLIIPYYSTEFK